MRLPQASSKTRDPQRHPRATAILVSLGLTFVLAIAGGELTNYAGYAKIAFALGVFAGGAFVYAAMLMCQPAGSSK